jgi:hypothetical protein
MTGNFGALDLRKKFLNIEKSATNGNKESLAKHASDLVKDFEAVQAALKALCKPFK